MIYILIDTFSILDKIFNDTYYGLTCTVKYFNGETLYDVSCKINKFLVETKTNDFNDNKYIIVSKSNENQNQWGSNIYIVPDILQLDLLLSKFLLTGLYDVKFLENLVRTLDYGSLKILLSCENYESFENNLISILFKKHYNNIAINYMMRLIHTDYVTIIEILRMEFLKRKKEFKRVCKI